MKSPSVAAALTGDHQGHSVSLIVVTHDNLTLVSAWVVGAETGDLHGSIQRTGSVPWQQDAATESLIHLDYITFGTEREVFSLQVSFKILLIIEIIHKLIRSPRYIDWVKEKCIFSIGLSVIVILCEHIIFCPSLGHFQQRLLYLCFCLNFSTWLELYRAQLEQHDVIYFCGPIRI